MASVFSIVNRYRMTAGLFVAALFLFAISIGADAAGIRQLTVEYIALGALLVPLSAVRTDFDVNKAGREGLAQGFAAVLVFAIAAFSAVVLAEGALHRQTLDLGILDVGILVVILSRVLVLKVMSETSEREESKVEGEERLFEQRPSGRPGRRGAKAL